MSLELAEQSIQLLYMSYKQMKTLSSFTTRQPIQFLKKSLTSVFLSLITSHAISTSRTGHSPSYRSRATTSYRGRATTSFMSYHQLKTLSLLSKDNRSKSWEKMWAKKTEIVCHWSLLMSLELAEQSIQLLTCHISR